MPLRSTVALFSPPTNVIELVCTPDLGKKKGRAQSGRAFPWGKKNQQYWRLWARYKRRKERRVWEPQCYSELGEREEVETSKKSLQLDDGNPGV